jgi:hypothetical protein
MAGKVFMDLKSLVFKLFQSNDFANGFAHIELKKGHQWKVLSGNQQELDFLFFWLD